MRGAGPGALVVISILAVAGFAFAGVAARKKGSALSSVPFVKGNRGRVSVRLSGLGAMTAKQQAESIEKTMKDNHFIESIVTEPVGYNDYLVTFQFKAPEDHTFIVGLEQELLGSKFKGRIEFAKNYSTGVQA